MITKKLKDEVYAWDPNAFKGKGYWFVLGTKGGLGRAASKNQAILLGKPPLGDTIPESPDVYEEDTEKKAKEEAAKKAKTEAIKKFKKESVKKDKEEEEPIPEGTGRSVEYRKKDREYAEAEDVRRTGLTRLIAQKMISGESLGKSIKGSISEKTKATLTGVREKFDFKKKFDSLNIAKALGGNLGATILGRATGRSTEDISYFTGIRPSTQNLNVSEEPTERLEPSFKQSEPTGKRKRVKKDVLHSKVSPGRSVSVAKGDSIADVLAKLYNLTKRLDEEEKKRFELQNNFKKERESEKQKFLDDLLVKLGGKKEQTKPTVEKVSKTSAGGIGAGLGMGGLFDGLTPDEIDKDKPKPTGQKPTDKPGQPLPPDLTPDEIDKPKQGQLKDDIKKLLEYLAQARNVLAKNPVTFALTALLRPSKLGDGTLDGIDELLKKQKEAETGSSAKVTPAPVPKDTSSTAATAPDTPTQTGVSPVVQPKTDNSTATPVPKTEYKSPLNEKEKEAFNRFNELLNKGGNESLDIKDLEDPITKKLWLESVKREGFLKEDSASATGVDTKPMDSNNKNTPIEAPPVPEPIDSTESSLKLGQYDESDFQKAMGTTALVNSPVTNIINNGGGDMGIEVLTAIRTADITMKKLQYSNYRTV
jgi:hypothetical protein